MKTAEYYATHPKAKAKRMSYQKEYNKSEKEKERRAELNKVNRDRGTYGNHDKMDAAHTKNGIVMKPEGKNRGSKDDMPGDKRARGGHMMPNGKWMSDEEMKKIQKKYS